MLTGKSGKARSVQASAANPVKTPSSSLARDGLDHEDAERYVVVELYRAITSITPRHCRPQMPTLSDSGKEALDRLFVCI